MYGEHQLCDIRKHTLLVPLFGSSCHCEQLFCSLKNVISSVRTFVIDECVERYMKIAIRMVLQYDSSKSSVRIISQMIDCIKEN
jgi:hypothetical protein